MPPSMRDRVFEGSLSAIVVASPEGTILDANARAADALRAPAASLAGMLVWDAPAWRDAPRVPEQLRVAFAAAARGVTVRHEIEVIADGEVVVFDLSCSPLAGAGERTELVIVEWRDVTHRRRAEVALRESEERFERIVSIAADAIISIDEDQRITLFNQGAETIFGYQAAEVLGKPLDMLLPRELGSLHAREVRSFGEAPDVARRMGQRRQIFGRRKSGEVFNAEASISKATVGNARVYTAVLRDVTERWAADQKKSELLAEAQAARATAESLTRQRDEMLGVVSHDLRNPLSAIAMCATQLAESDLADHDREHLAATIHQAALWSNRLIGDLVDIASLDAGRLSVKPRRVDPVITIARALNLFEQAAAERTLELQARTAEHLPAVHADPERLLQVLGNLIGNAMRFTGTGGLVTVGAREAGEAVEFSVRDTGRGIPAENLERIFERRWHTGEAGPDGGTGLGLTIARGIVEAHGGRISVESEPGRGTQVTFTIPLAPTARE